MDTTEKMMSKVRALLNTAESYEEKEETRAAAANYRAKAEELMREYRLAQEDLIASDPTSVEPISINIDLCEYGTSFSQQYINIFYSCADHAGIRTRFTWAKSTDTGKLSLIAQATGYESDIRYAEYLFTSARLVFQERLEPKVKAELSQAENCYRLRSAGIDRQRIAELVFGERSHNNGLKVARLYKETCATKGEDPKLSGRGVNAKTFREVYAREFSYHFSARLRMARNAADSTGGAMVFHGRQERVDEAFYARFPEYRPSTEVAEVKPCERCEKRKDGSKCAAHRPSKWTKADQARYERMNESSTAVAARAAGQDAARAVELERSSQANRLGEDSTRATVREVTGLELEG